MPNFSARIFFRSFRFALKGLRYALRHEQSFRVQTTIALCILLLTLVVGVTREEALVLVLVVSSVLVLELLNTVLEKFIDALKPRIDYFVGMIKDLMAAAVFVASVGAVVIGLIIFVPKLLGR